MFGLPPVGAGIGFIGAFGAGRDPAGPPMPENIERSPVWALDIGCVGRCCCMGGTKFG